MKIENQKPKDPIKKEDNFYSLFSKVIKHNPDKNKLKKILLNLKRINNE